MEQNSALSVFESKQIVNEGGEITKNTRKAIDEKASRQIASNSNFLDPQPQKTKKTSKHKITNKRIFNRHQSNKKCK